MGFVDVWALLELRASDRQYEAGSCRDVAQGPRGGRSSAACSGVRSCEVASGGRGRGDPDLPIPGTSLRPGVGHDAGSEERSADSWTDPRASTSRATRPAGGVLCRVRQGLVDACR